jgi:hypothetical protein
MDVLNTQAAGWVATVVATVFFGSNYLVVKKFPIADGMAFQWV